MSHQNPSAADIYKSYYPLMLRYARSWMPDQAEDIVQDAILNYMKYPRRKNGPIEGWLVMLTKTAAHSKFQKEKRYQQKILNPETIPSANKADCSADKAGSSASNKCDKLLDLAEKIDPKKGALLRLKVKCGLSYREIARITGKSYGAVRIDIHRIKKRLKTNSKNNLERFCS